MRRRFRKNICFHAALTFLALTVVFLNASPASALNFTTFDVSGASWTIIRGINDSGQITGSYSDGTRTHGFLYSGGTLTTIDYGPTGTGATGINDSSQIVGVGTSLYGDASGFLLDGNTFTPIATPHRPSVANGINNLGQIVGQYGNLNYWGTGYLYNSSDGSFTSIQKPWSSYGTTALGINDAGDIVGTYSYAGGTDPRAYLLSSSIFSRIDFPNALITSAADINNLNQIVGAYGTTSFTHGYLYSNGSYTPIDVPDASITYVTSINDLGQMAGWYVDGSGIAHGFVTTVPEPSTMLLLGAGLAGLVALRRRFN